MTHVRKLSLLKLTPKTIAQKALSNLLTEDRSGEYQFEFSNKLTEGFVTDTVKAGEIGISSSSYR